MTRKDRKLIMEAKRKQKKDFAAVFKAKAKMKPLQKQLERLWGKINAQDEKIIAIRERYQAEDQ